MINTLDSKLTDRKFVNKPWYVQTVRAVILLVINSISLFFALNFAGLNVIFSPVEFLSFIFLVALLNALLRPLLIYITLPFTILTFGLITFIVNGFIFVVAAWIYSSGDAQAGLWSAIVVSTYMALITWFLTTIMSIDDPDSYFQNAVKKIGLKRKLIGADSNKPGFLFFEIDGLSASVLQQALIKGEMPTLARLIKESHTFSKWETDLPAQTCASQRGILFGNNKDVIGFRWYDRKTKKIITASHPKHVLHLEKEVDDGKGLLSKNGASIGNMFSGGAELTAFTTAATGSDKKNPYDPLSYYFNSPFNYVRTLTLVIYEMIHEVKDQVLQKLQNREPRVKRGLVAIFQRAVMCIFVPDIAVQTTIGEMFAGRDTIYTTYAGYDELSHLAGLDRPESMRGLRRVDSYIYQLLLAAKQTPRPYHIIILSDHGQSMGWTFKHAFNQSLGDLVKSGLNQGTEVSEIAGVDEVSVVFGDILSDIKKSLQSKFSKEIFSKIFHKSSQDKDDSSVILDSNTRAISGEGKEGDPLFTLPEVLVQVGGNLGMIYFTKSKKRLLLEQIENLHPNLIFTLSSHEGIGFLLVDSKHGPVAIGPKGRIYLKRGILRKTHVEGENPLINYGKNAVQHLLRVHSFNTCPDILVNSVVSPATGQIYGFEPQCGAHGALGGPQNHPFLLFPSLLKRPDKPIIGAENVYKQLKQWIRLVAP